MNVHKANQRRHSCKNLSEEPVKGSILLVKTVDIPEVISKRWEYDSVNARIGVCLIQKRSTIQLTGSEP
jgi:hypothetical protein